jgi:hypothetical protein
MRFSKMMNGVPVAQPNHTRNWRQFESKFKRAMFLGIAGITIMLTLTIGPQFFYILASALLCGSLIIYQDDIVDIIENNKGCLMGAAVGFMLGGGGPLSVIGVLILGWMGHEIHNMIRWTANTANQIIETTEPYRHPINTTQRHVGALLHRARGLGPAVSGFLNDVGEGIYNWIDSPETPNIAQPAHHAQPAPIDPAAHSNIEIIDEPELDAPEAPIAPIATPVAVVPDVREAVLNSHPVPAVLFQSPAGAPANDPVVAPQASPQNAVPLPQANTPSRWGWLLPEGAATECIRLFETKVLMR